MQRKKRKKTVRSRKKRAPLLPETIQSFIARRVTDIIGGFCLFTAGSTALMLISYHPQDPSLNTAGQTDHVYNFLGLPGAWGADLLLQTLGLAGWVFVITLGIWGYRILKRLPFDNPGHKISLLLFAVLFCAIALARITAFDGWGISAYMGGSIGGLILKTLGDPLQSWIGENAYLFVATSAAMLGSVCWLLSLGVTVTGWTAAMKKIYHLSLYMMQQTLLALRRFISWHQKYAHLKIKPPKAGHVRQAYLQDDAADTVTLRGANDAPSPSLSARKKPKVMPPQDSQHKKQAQRQQKLDLRAAGEEWRLPALGLLDDLPDHSGLKYNESALQKNAELLQNTLADFGVKGEILKVSPGPIVTLYEMEPAPGTKTSRVVGLSDDIARSMSAVSVRVAVVPGKNAIGIELPNAKRETIFLKELLSSDVYEKTTAKLPLILGKNIAGDPIIADLAKMPHLLVAGTTGSGKSVSVNTMILSLLYTLSPEQCRFIMIDPKMLELSVYDDIPHLLTPVVTEAHQAITALKWAVNEMENRYRAMSKVGVRNITGFNERVRTARKKGEILTHKVQTGFDLDTGKPVYEEQPISLNDLPYIVIIVDEFADLMLVAGKEVENAIQRLAQMARAAGIHLIMATQRPSVDVITGVIKANFPTRISFQVTSRIDSRTILGDSGAEQLLGMGDMLYMAGGGRLTRVHGPFVSDGEVEQITAYLRAQGAPDYINGVTEDPEGDALGNMGGGSQTDELYHEAVAIVLSERKASTSYIQRRLQIGYNRAARIIEQMEKEGIISAPSGAGKREILIDNYGT